MCSWSIGRNGQPRIEPTNRKNAARGPLNVESNAEVPRMTARILFLALALLACSSQALLAGPLQDDLKARRARMMERLTPQTLAVVWSAPQRVYSTDVAYEY